MQTKWRISETAGFRQHPNKKADTKEINEHVTQVTSSPANLYYSEQARNSHFPIDTNCHASSTVPSWTELVKNALVQPWRR
jgi:hypothetical protein